MGFLERVANVKGVINYLASGVMIIFTLAPFLTNKRVRCAALYAAIPPVTPRIIFLLANMFQRAIPLKGLMHPLREFYDIHFLQEIHQ